MELEVNKPWVSEADASEVISLATICVDIISRIIKERQIKILLLETILINKLNYLKL